MSVQPLIRTAADARALRDIARTLLSSPVSFDGTLDDLAQAFILPNLPEPSVVTAFHRALVDYCGRKDALFLIRKVPRTERRTIYSTSDGTRFKSTDNAPSWWVHATLFQGWAIDEGAFGEVVTSMPAHIHDVARTCPPTASGAGWHIAHIFSVNDRRTEWERFTRLEVMRRFVRSVHPCNYFLLPTPEWQRWGSDARVIGYFASLYADRYADVWSDFLRLANGSGQSLARSLSPIPYVYGASPTSPSFPRRVPRPEAQIGPLASEVRTNSFARANAPAVAAYHASRLTFKRDVIEPLRADAVFRVITPLGTFEMTKAELYATFPGVPLSVSYRDRGTYNYSVLPPAAARFRVSD
jgi:hypothetical protein